MRKDRETQPRKNRTTRAKPVDNCNLLERLLTGTESSKKLIASQKVTISVINKFINIST